MKKGLATAALVSLICAVWNLSYPPAALGQDSFYEGKTIRLIQARRAGGAGDMRVRAIVPVLPKYIPGNPKVAIDYMPGAGGRVAANYIYNNARPDGLTLANLTAGTIPLAVLGAKGVEFDIDKLIHLGTFYSVRHTAFFTWHEAGLDTLEKLRAATGVRIGEQDVGFPPYVRSRVFAWLLGLREPRFVVGYSSPEADLALVRREIDARQQHADVLLVEKPEWIRKKLIHIHSIMEVPEGLKHPEYPNVPEIGKFAGTERQRRLMAMYRAFQVFGQPTVAPPGLPAERLAVLKEAFRQAYKDPEFHRLYKKLTGADPSPLMPDDVLKVVTELPREPELVQLYNALAGPGPLPSR